MSAANAMTAPARDTAREPAATVVALILVVAIGLAVRAYYLSLPMKYDEAATFLEYARFPLWSGMGDYSSPNNHLLETLLIHLSTNAFANHEWAIRLPDFVFGTLAIPATFVLGRMFANSEVALVAASLVAGSSKLVEYSVNARGYTLQVFLSIALAAIGVQLVRAEAAWAWAAFVVVAALGFFAIPTMLYVYAGMLLWVWAQSGWSRVTLKRLVIVSCAVCSLTAVLYSPVLIQSGIRALLFNRFVRPLPWHDFFHQIPTLPAEIWNSWTDAVPAPLLIMLLIGVSVAIFRARDLVALLLSLVTAAVPLLLVQHVVPPSRTFLFALPFVAICASAGLLHLLDRWHGRTRFALLRIAAVLLAAWMASAIPVTGSVVASEETGSFQDIAEVMDYLNAVAGPDDLVLVVLPADQPFRYYLQSWGAEWQPYYPLLHTSDYDDRGPDTRATSNLFIVLRDHHGPRPSNEEQPMTLARIAQFYTARSAPKLVFSGPYTSVYQVVGGSIKHGFCEVFCFHRTRTEQ